jgi:hypothetical protein
MTVGLRKGHLFLVIELLVVNVLRVQTQGYYGFENLKARKKSVSLLKSKQKVHNSQPLSCVKVSIIMDSSLHDCCVDAIVNSECHLKHFTTKKSLIILRELADEIHRVIKLRINFENISTIYAHHNVIYFRYYDQGRLYRDGDPGHHSPLPPPLPSLEPPVKNYFKFIQGNSLLIDFIYVLIFMTNLCRNKLINYLVRIDFLKN